MKIKDAINEKKQNNDFIEWTGDFLSPEYHKNKGYFSSSDFDYVKNIDDAASIFNTKVKHKGFQRAGGFNIPGEENTIVWCPAAKNEFWSNTLFSDRTYIREEKIKATDEERKTIIEKAIQNKEKRVTFFKEKDYLGFNFYRFVGVFEIDEVSTRRENCSVWKRTSDRYNIKQ